ncbi:TonB-dependent receptor [Thiomicrorhabdus sp. 6S3-12]|uniref:TonB-dependent receptor n=1 Tax=Thiomicrorhabdus sp. 6S3-12 TaxID=2819681 RepID=UPI001AAD7322|nr:TonB-dependent receptor [Thiomicrorhabdus sp. 6S3-12]MBO1923364.1 TonB-dependent receptor [Thiomicrorhabdus sp. 6S3-12]
MHPKPFHYNALISALLLSFTQFGYADDSSELSKVTISSSTIEDRFESDADIPASTTVISGEAVEAKHATNIIEVLRSIPGVTADLAGEGDGIKIKIRGVDNQRYMGEKPGVAIVIDGVPVFERTGKVNIDLDNIESIRVVKGGASYLFGEDALAGAVIITTKRGAAHAGVTLEADLGSYGYTRTLVKAGVAEEDFAGHVQVTDRHNDGFYALSQRDAEAVSGALEYYLNDHSELTFGFEDAQRFRDRDGSVRGVTAAEEDPEGEEAGRGYTRMFNVDLSRLNLTYSNDFSDSGNFMAVAYQYKDITDFWSAPIKYDGDGNPVGDDQVDMYANLNDYEQVQRGLKLELRDSFGEFALMGGVELKKNTFDEQTTVKEDYRTYSRGETITAGTIKSDSYREEITKAVYGEAKFRATESTTLTGNYRFDRIELDGHDRLEDSYDSNEFNVHSWRFGADQNLSEKTSLYGAVSTGFRAPSLSELSTNADLEPETTFNYELGVRSELNLFGWNTHMNSSVFYIDRRDFITNSTGQYVNSNVDQLDDVESYYDNIGQTTSKGFELALQTEKKHNFSFDFAYTYLISKFGSYDDFYLALGNPYGVVVNSEEELTTGTYTTRAGTQTCTPDDCVYFKPYDNSGNYVPRTPQHMANLRINWYPTSKVTFTTEIDYRGESYADEINQEKMPARTLLNLGLEYQTKAQVVGGTQGLLTLFLKVDNVFNDQFYSIVRGTYDSNSDGVYDAEDLSINVDPGRVWMAGLKVKF